MKRAQEWIDAGFPVRGHVCEGLTRIQSLIDNWWSDEIVPRSSAYGCHPNILHNGLLRGCDATGVVPIDYCPACGVRLTGDGSEWGDGPVLR